MTVRHGSRFASLALAAAAVLVLLGGNANASPSSAKRIAFVDGTTLKTVAANATTTTTLAAGAANPSISATGDLILIQSGGGISQVDLAGTVTPVCGVGSDPAIAPNGRELVYVNGTTTVTTASLLGCATIATFANGSDPAWSPDGTRIVFVRGGDLVVASRGGGGETTFTSTAAETHPAWSPDGTRIAYSSGGDIFTMNADGTGRTQVTTSGGVSPSWSPSGDEIVYATSAVAGALRAVPAAGGTSREIVASGASTPDWGLAVANITAPVIFRASTDPSSPAPVPAATNDVFDGDQLTADTGEWASISGPTGISYQWTRCSSSGTGCTPISGATSGTYTVGSLDVGATIRVAVTLSTADGSAPGTAAQTRVVKSAAPRNVTPPSITGTPILGTTLTADAGTWTGSNIVYTYQWLRCDLAGGNCAAIGPETSQNVYTPVSADVDKTLKVRVKGTNGDGSATADSIASPPVSSNVPTNTVLPAIAESTLTTTSVTSFTATTGTWTGAGTLTYKYQWRRCDSSGGNCKDIAGAVSSFYTAASADINTKLRVAVTATNLYGTATAVSEPSDLLAGSAPVNTTRPSISGTERVGSVLFVGTGTWSGTLPLTYTYQWQRCNASGSGCAAIAGSTSSSYVATPADVGATLAVQVTARNAAGSATVSSAPTDAIEAAAAGGGTTATRPANTKLPTIAGTLARGKSLRATVGTWTGTTPMTYSYQWLRCPATGTACVAVHGSTTANYKLGTADVGKRIRLVVTAGNGAGSTAASSAITAIVKATAPAAVRVVNGNAKANRLTGTARAERIDGKGGNDRIDGRGGKDTLIGGTGNDTIMAADGIAETVSCGPGRDAAVVDRGDRVSGCEKVTRRAPKKATVKKK